VRHRNALYFWFDNDFDQARSFLEHWSPLYSRVDYMWQRKESQQNDSMSISTNDGMFPRLDYLILRGLFNINDGQAGKGGNPAPPTGNNDQAGGGIIIILSTA
jgi:hypothetical protein